MTRRAHVEAPTFGSLMARAAALVFGQVLEVTPSWAELVARIEANTTLLAEIGEILMALTQNEQQAVNELSSAINGLSSDLAGVLAAAQQARVDMQTQIDGLEAGKAVDKATIAAMQAAADAVESDVIGALTPLTQQVKGLDDGLKASPADGGSALTPEAGQER
jgi:flagellar hook-basal body complex protein FliE